MRFRTREFVRNILIALIYDKNELYYSLINSFISPRDGPPWAEVDKITRPT